MSNCLIISRCVPLFNQPVHTQTLTVNMTSHCASNIKNSVPIQTIGFRAGGDPSKRHKLK
jgi:hypothetical protein